MPMSPALRPCSPHPVCGPAPMPRLPRKSTWRQLADTVGAGLRSWRNRERLYAEMCRLDYRELKDLGITEGDVELIVARARTRRN